MASEQGTATPPAGADSDPKPAQGGQEARPPFKWEAWIALLGLYLAAWLGVATWRVMVELPPKIELWSKPDACAVPEAAGKQAHGAMPSPATSPDSSGSPAPSLASDASPDAAASTPPESEAAADHADATAGRERAWAACLLRAPHLLWWLGCLGAAISAVLAFARRLGEQPKGRDALTRQWIPYYLARPPIGGVFGMIVVLALELLEFHPSSFTKLLFLAFAAGLVSRQASLKMREVALSLFTTRDPLTERAKGGQPPEATDASTPQPTDPPPDRAGTAS